MSTRRSTNPGGKVVMQRLADLAGVSRATVSRALSDSPLVAKETKQKIRKLANDHKYVLNEAARNFRHGRTNIIGLILMIEEDSEQSQSYDFYLEMMGSIADALALASYDMLLVHKPFRTASEFIRSRVCQQSEGLIFVGQGRRHDKLNDLADYDLPMVVWGADLPGRRYPIVGGDNVGGARAAVDHLFEQGYRNIAFFGDKDLPEAQLRYQGYCESFRSHNHAIDAALELPVPFEPGPAAAVVDSFFDKSPHIDGIFCCSDIIALNTVASLAKHGRSVPADVGVVGYDDISAAKRAFPALSTIDQRIREGGEALVHNLLAQINGEQGTDTIIASNLVVRETSVPAGKMS